jgi:hypothetical protein
LLQVLDIEAFLAADADTPPQSRPPGA